MVISKFNKFLTLLLSILVVSGCIGTIKDVEQVDQSIIKQDVKLEFMGVSACNAISDQRVEVSFDPALILKGKVKPEDIIYKVFLNGNYDNSVSSMMAKNLRVNADGKYFLEVAGLTLNTLYTFTVRAQDPTSGASDENIISCNVRTLSSKLPIFDGIQEIVPYPGVEGQSSLLLKWNTAKAAEYLLGGIPANGYKIAKYNIYQSTVSDNPDTMILLTTLNEITNTPVTQFQVSGLLKGQNYHYMIRALDETGREDKNRIVLTGRTSTPQSVLFNGITKLDVPASASGYTSLRASWTTSPEGDFNTFRMFAVPDTSPLFNASSIDPNDATYLVGDSTNTTTKSYLITGLLPNKEYAIYVVACLVDNNLCTTKSGERVKLKAVTTPALAPFAGVSSVTALEGSAGLSNATISWSIPGVSSGVCDGIKVYEADQAVKACNDAGLLPNEACVNSTAISCSSSSVTISNLKEGQQYCFSAKVYEQARTQEGEASKKCITTKFDSPVFQTTPICTAQEGGGKVKLDWQAPNPEGLYSNYLLIVKKDNGAPLNPSTWIGSAKSVYAGEMNESAIPIADRYKFFLRPKNTLNYTIGSLSPDTTYNIIVKTYMSANNINYYDRGTTVLTCKTKPLSVNVGGWEHVLSVGPRINGLADHRTSPGTEKLSANTTADYSLNDVAFAAHGIEKEALVVSRTITLPKVIKDDSKITSKDGIVQLMWKTFTALDGRSIDQYLFDEGISLSPGDGYYLYRKITPSYSTPAEYEAMLNQIQGSNSGWEVLNPDAALVPNAKNIMMFNDYLPNQFHPINGQGAGDFRDKANTGKVAWYTVRFKVNGKLATVAANINKDAIIQVIIPPANMASIHHWMVNKKTCEIYNKEVDRNNNYRCLFGGMGSKEIDGNYYFDNSGHNLIDRWSLGCNFTRYDEPKYCRTAKDASTPINQSLTRAQGNATWYLYDSYTYGDAELENKDGECMTNIDPAYKEHFPNTSKGAVLYNSYDMSCYYRVNSLLATNSTNNQTNNWKRLSDGSLSPLAAKVNETILPKTISDEFLGRVYPQNSDPESIKGIGDIMTSNDSSLPPIMFVSQNQAYYLCQSHAIKIQTGGNASVPIRKRLISSQEHNISSLPHPDTTLVEKKALELSNPISGTLGNTVTYPVSYVYRYAMGRRMVDTVGTANGCSTIRYTGSGGTYPTVMNKLTKIIAGSFAGQSSPYITVTGSYDVGGLGDGKYSGTERCVSGFGIQDYIGNNDYWFNDQMLCKVDATGADGICDVNPNINKINEYESLTGKSWPQFRYKVGEKYYYGQSSYVNALGNWFNRSLFINKTAATSSFGVPDRRSTQYLNTSNNLSYPAAAYYYDGARTMLHYPQGEYDYSFINGELVNCNSGSCHSDDGINLLEMNLAPNMVSMRKNYVEIEYNTAALTADSFFVKSKKRSTLKPEIMTYYMGATSYMQFFFLSSLINEIVDEEKITHAYSANWKSGQDALSFRTGARCAVKVELDLAGNVKAVDDHEQQ